MDLMRLFMAAVTWDTSFEADPDPDDPIASGDDEIRELKQATRERLAKEHEMDTSSGLVAEDGWHLEGSARAYMEDAEPANRPDGATALTNDDAGRIWFDTNNGYLGYVYVSAAAGFTGFIREVTRGAVQGGLIVQDDIMGPLIFPRAATIKRVVARVGTAPTGANLIIDIDRYDSSDALQGSIFDGAGNRITIAATEYTDDKDDDGSELSSEAALDYGDYLLVNIDQIGSTVAGADLVVVIEAILG